MNPYFGTSLFHVEEVHGALWSIMYQKCYIFTFPEFSYIYTLKNKGARAKCLKWAYFAVTTSPHVSMGGPQEVHGRSMEGPQDAVGLLGYCHLFILMRASIKK